MEQLVITANQLATLIEASYFYNFTTVLAALFVYDLITSFFAVGVSFLKSKLHKK